MEEQAGLKFDQEKLRTDLVPITMIEAVAKAYTIGAKKYGDLNWKNGMKWSRIYGAILRHLFAFMKGSKFDPEGQEHLGSAIWGLATLLEYERLKLGEDDRPGRVDLSNEYIAGLVDGEGHIGMCRDSLNNDNLRAIVQIQMTTLEPISSIANKFGGSVRKYSGSGKGKNNKDVYAWKLSSKESILNILVEISPFLVLKRRQANLLIEYLSLVLHNSRGHKLPQELVEKRNVVFKQLQELNRRGV